MEFFIGLCAVALLFLAVVGAAQVLRWLFTPTIAVEPKTKSSPMSDNYTGIEMDVNSGLPTLRALLLLRLRLRSGYFPNGGMAIPFEELVAHQEMEIVHIFFIHKGKPVLMEDDAGLFPSDALVTKMRLLVG